VGVFCALGFVGGAPCDVVGERADALVGAVSAVASRKGARGNATPRSRGALRSTPVDGLERDGLLDVHRLDEAHPMPNTSVCHVSS